MTWNGFTTEQEKSHLQSLYHSTQEPAWPLRTRCQEQELIAVFQVPANQRTVYSAQAPIQGFQRIWIFLNSFSFFSLFLSSLFLSLFFLSFFWKCQRRHSSSPKKNKCERTCAHLACPPKYIRDTIAPIFMAVVNIG